MDPVEKPIRERPITRILASLLGLFFICSPVIMWLVHPKEFLEDIGGPIEKQVAMVLFFGAGVACGSMFVFVGVTGAQPKWLTQCAQKRSR